MLAAAAREAAAGAATRSALFEPTVSYLPPWASAQTLAIWTLPAQALAVQILPARV